MDFVQKTQKKIETSRKKLVKTIELKSYKKLAVNFLILTANLIIIILYFSLSQAKVVIVPAKEDITHTISIPIKEEVSLADNELAVSGNIMSIEVSTSKTFPVDATSKVEKNATGAVTIQNTTRDRNQIFVKNTRFVNEAGLEIKIDKQVQIAPGKSITISAFASEPGAKGEVTSASGRFQVAALAYLKDKIYAEISTDFTGGEIEIKVLTPTAFNKAKDSLQAELRDKGYETLSQGSSDISKDDLAVEITDVQSDANPEDENVDTFTMTAKATVSAFSYDEKRAKEIIKQELIKRIPPDKLLIDFTGEPQITVNKTALQIDTTATAQIQRKIPEAALNQEDIVGMNEDEVREYFIKITGIRDVQIEFWPFWVRSVPNLKDHVNIEIKK